MNRTKIRGIVALTLLSVPYWLLFAAGSVWLYQYHMLLGWFAVSLAVTLLGWWLIRPLRRGPPSPQAGPELAWPPIGQAAWKDVEVLAVRLEAENLALDEPERLQAVLREIVESVARHYNPASPEPWLEIPVPYVMRIVELVARDVREATLTYVPGSHILTIRDWRRLWELAGLVNRSYFWYRVVQFLVNAPAALVREVRDVALGKLQTESVFAVKRWAVGFCVRRAGYYAIQLYGGHLALNDEGLRATLTPRSDRDVKTGAAREAAVAEEPLRVLIVGQSKAGKSSLINALFGEYRAATDVIPRTRFIEPYVLEREGIPRAILLDSAGYEGSDPKDFLGQTEDEVLRCDLAICVCSATTAARNADRRFLDALGGLFERRLDRHRPVVLVALTHIDLLRPFDQWEPPYQLQAPSGPKAQQIAAAVEAVAQDLGLPVGDVIPVCLHPDRYYNLDEALIPAILQRLPEALRVKYLRCLRQLRDAEYWQRLWQQAVAAGRVVLKKIYGGT